MWLVKDLSPGTKVGSRLFSELAGKIRSFEPHKSGKASEIVYVINWGNRELAAELLGSYFIFAPSWTIEAVENQKEENLK